MAFKEAFCKTKGLSVMSKLLMEMCLILIHYTFPYRGEVKPLSLRSVYFDISGCSHRCQDTPHVLVYLALNMYLNSESIYISTAYVHCENQRPKCSISPGKITLVAFPADHNPEVVNWAMLTMKGAFKDCRQI